MSALEHKRLRTRIYSFFMGPEREWPAFRANVEPVSAEMSRVSDFDGGANGRSLAEVVGDVFREHQNAVAQNVRVFAGVLDRSQWGGLAFDTIGGLTELGVRSAMQWGGLSLEDVASLDSVAYFEGYVRESVVIFPNGSGEGSHGAPHWRLRVLVSQPDAYALREALEGTTAGLRLALETDLGELVGNAGREGLVAGVVLRIVDQVTGRQRYGSQEQGGERLLEDVRRLLEIAQADEPMVDADLADLLWLPGSRPIGSDGLLGLSLGELFERPEAWFHGEQRRLDDVLEGWRRILTGSSVPEDPVAIQSAPRVTKYWFMEMGATEIRQDRVAYVPLSYVP